MKVFYYKKNDFTLYHEDSLEFLKSFSDNTFDMIFADPPYFLSSGSFSCQNGKRVSVKKGEWDLSNGLKNNYEFQFQWIKECARILKPNGTIWISGTYHSIYQCGFALQMNDFHILNDIIWFKPNAAPNLSCRVFTASHETLIWAKKNKQQKQVFNYKKMVEWENNYQKKITCEHCGKSSDHEVFHVKGKQMRSVWAITGTKKSEKTFGKHPTQKPLELLKRIIVASTNEDDLILDPFTGSSTTGLVASLLKRKFIGIDNEKKYLDLSIKRYEKLLKDN